MPFSWLDRAPQRTDGHDRRTKAACAELASRAGMLYRLGFTEAAATARLTARIAWEHEGRRPESLSDQAILKIVRDTFARRPGVSRLRTIVALCLLFAACPGAGTPSSRRAPPIRQYSLTDLVGGWRWVLRTTESGTTRVETEEWRFRPSSLPTQLVGRYLRDVEVQSDDRVAFQCNQRPWYRQRAVFDVVVEVTKTGFAIKETAYHSEPGPCDLNGFRHIGAYDADVENDRLVLRWEGGSQTLARLDSAVVELPEDPWSSTPGLFGPWRWAATSYDDDGNLRDETEWWELTRRTATKIDATYRRRVTVRSPDGRNITCASSPTWSFDDAYVLDGRREEEHWHFYELAADPGDHPCLRNTPHRALDEATAEQIGDYLILEWRGKRRQILYRPE